MKKRSLALMLCLALVLGLAAPVYAEESEPAGDGVEITVEPETPAPSESVEPETPAPSESVEPETPVPSESVEPETPAPSESVEPETPAPSESVEPETPAPGESVEPETPAPGESVEPTAPVTELCEHGNDPATCEQCQAAAQQQADGGLYAALLAAESLEEVEQLVSDLTEEEAQAFLESLTEAQYAALEAHLVELSAQNYEIPETVVFTDAGPFLPPVEVEAAPRLRAARSVRQAAAEDENGLILDKTAVPDGAGGYKIRLEAYTTGTVTTTTTTSPVDIVLVLDQSGSMAYDFNGNSTNTNTARRQYAMKQAVNNFIAAVNAKYDGAHSDHRMALVTFGSNASLLQSWTFVNSAGAETLTRKINGLPDSPSGATNVGAGMQQAETLMGSGYSYAGTNTTRQKVVIVFTDGVPTTEKDFSTTVANNAISSAKHLKDAGVTVYSVGIFNGANPDETYGASGFDTNSDGTEGSKWVKDTWGLFPGTDFPEADRPAGNRFLNYLSSNYGDAVNIGLERTTSGLGIFHYKITYTVTENASQSSNRYYLTADSSASLNTIFQTISEQIGSANIDLGATTKIRDVVTPYFTMPENTSAISLYTADYDGTTFGEEELAPDGVTAEIDGDTVTVTGFDFNANFVSDTPRGENETYGKKLVIEFTVTPREGFWGGDEVPTNGADSGVYTADGSEVEFFEVPKVNVPLNVPDFTGNTVNVYYGGAAPADSTLYTPIPLPTGEDDWKDDFVTIGDYTVAGPVSTTADGVYTVSVTVTSGNQNQPKKANATVRVFLPQFAVEAQDVWTDYGVAVPLAQWGLIQEAGAPKVTVTWKREGVTESVTMANAEPAISDYVFTFTASGTPDGTLSGGTYTTGTQDADFRVGLTSCQVGSTGYSVPADALTVVPAVSGEAHDFTVHINKFQMTVTKTATGADTYLQDFIFTVSDGTQSFQIVIHGEGSKTVVGLICGKTYTVTEEEGWSWRYQPDGTGTKNVTCTTNYVSNTAPAEASLTAGTVTMHNRLDNDKWLSGENMKANKFNKTRRRAVRKEG